MHAYIHTCIYIYIYTHTISLSIDLSIYLYVCLFPMVSIGRIVAAALQAQSLPSDFGFAVAVASVVQAAASVASVKGAVSMGLWGQHGSRWPWCRMP